MSLDDRIGNTGDEKFKGFVGNDNVPPLPKVHFLRFVHSLAAIYVV